MNDLRLSSFSFTFSLPPFYFFFPSLPSFFLLFSSFSLSLQIFCAATTTMPHPFLQACYTWQRKKDELKFKICAGIFTNFQNYTLIIALQPMTMLYLIFKDQVKLNCTEWCVHRGLLSHKLESWERISGFVLCEPPQGFTSSRIFFKYFPNLIPKKSSGSCRADNLLGEAQVILKYTHIVNKEIF